MQKPKSTKAMKKPPPPPEIKKVNSELFDALWNYCNAYRKHDVTPNRALAGVLVTFLSASGFNGDAVTMETRRDLVLTATNAALELIEEYKEE